MKICAYIQQAYAKQNYKKECFDTRQFVGLRVVVDAIERHGYEVEYAGMSTVHEYDVILVSITSDCDWWPFIQERLKWRKGNYKVIVGGAGVLHITPFLPYADYFVFGRGENNVPALIRILDGKSGEMPNSVAESSTFDDNGIYYIEQVNRPYDNEIRLSDKKTFKEKTIGCNHKCLFCGYTWQRKYISPLDHYAMDDALFGNIADKERAMIDIKRDPKSVDFSKLRTTAMDGMSERLRFMVNKKISRDDMVNFIRMMIDSDAKPHQLKLYNIVGYPTETQEDWWEFYETLVEADGDIKRKEKQWSIVLHCTPFRAMPATPLACAPMSKVNYRGRPAKVLGKGLKGNLIYQGKNLWCVESMGTESLSTVEVSAIAHRGKVEDSENIARLCSNKKFWSASNAVKMATLERYFDMDYLFGAFTPETLPSRYLRTYCKVEKVWEKFGANKKV